MLTFGDVVNAHMELCAAGSLARYFLTQKEIGVTPQSLGGIYGIMIGDRHQIHAAPFERLIDLPMDRCNFRGKCGSAAEPYTFRNESYAHANRNACFTFTARITTAM